MNFFGMVRMNRQVLPVMRRQCHGRIVIVETSREDYFLNNGGEWQEHPYGAHLVTEAEIRELIAWLCQDSVYAYADEIPFLPMGANELFQQNSLD